MWPFKSHENANRSERRWRVSVIPLGSLGVRRALRTLSAFLAIAALLAYVWAEINAQGAGILVALLAYARAIALGVLATVFAVLTISFSKLDEFRLKIFDENPERNPEKSTPSDSVKMAKEVSVERPPLWMGDGSFSQEVVGESNYQSALYTIANGRKPEGHELDVLACLLPEPDNPHDEFAIAVWIQNEKAGYLSRKAARIYSQELAVRQRQGEAAFVAARIVGGWDDGETVGSFGVRLDMAYPLSAFDEEWDLPPVPVPPPQDYALGVDKGKSFALKIPSNLAAVLALILAIGILLLLYWWR